MVQSRRAANSLHRADFESRGTAGWDFSTPYPSQSLRLLAHLAHLFLGLKNVGSGRRRRSA
jgi:hypothetical protein